jgi:hypothetical protein
MYPVYEKRAISGQLRMDLDYASRGDCGPSDAPWDDVVVTRTTTYDFRI